jgi:hypothetical protein
MGSERLADGRDDQGEGGVGELPDPPVPVRPQLVVHRGPEGQHGQHVRLGGRGGQLLEPGLEKTRFLKKKNQPSGFFWVFWFFLGRVFRAFSVSRILLGASRL